MIAAGVCLAGVAILVAPSVLTRVETASDRASSPAELGHRQVALVPGAGLTASGTPSAFLQSRLDGAIRLYRMGKVDGLLLSGDNSVAGYNEPAAMRTYALAHGIPAAAITVDDAGYNTYDSCYRARDVFGVKSAIVVTQSYHLPRAVYLCRSLGIDAAGLGMPDWGRYRLRVMAAVEARELLASVKAVWDADVSHPTPQVLGAPLPLHLDPAP